MQNASYYDKVYSGKYFVSQARIEAIAKLCKGHILDLGCGDGSLGMIYDGPYTGIDFSSAAIGIASRDTKKDHRYFPHNCFSDPIPEGKYDTVVLGQILEHITEEAEQQLMANAVATVGKGRIIITVPKGKEIPDPAHIRTFTENDLEKRMRQYGNVFFRPMPDHYIGLTIDGEARLQLSVALIVKDEHSVLARCLESIKSLANELVIVDTGSKDNTVKIAKKFGAKIGHFPWCDDFAAARNYAESLCTGEWIFWIDADEVLAEGHEVIRTLIQNPDLQGIRPWLIFEKDQYGNPVQPMCRQEMIHRNNGRWRWCGAAHNYLEGPNPITDSKQIVYDHLGRPEGDRPNHKDIFKALRQNLGTSFDQRHLFYLLRQHWYAHQYQECIGLCKVLLEQKPGWLLERSDTALLMGDCYKILGRLVEAEAAYHRAIEECGNWAEPYYKLGTLAYETKNYRQGVAYYSACLAFEEPPDSYADASIYQWRAHDMLSVCLSRIGRWEEAIHHGQIALGKQPDNERVKNNMKWYLDHLKDQNGIQQV